MRCTSVYRSPLGEMLLASDGSALTGLWFEGQRRFAAGLAPDARARDGLAVFDEARSWLDAYFTGGRPDVFLRLVYFMGWQVEVCHRFGHDLHQPACAGP